MKKCLLLLLPLLLTIFSRAASAQSFPAYTADMLMERVQQSDTVFVVNFWATWCAPCVKELPAFDSLSTAYVGKKVKVLLVSFDFKEDYQQKLKAFVQKKHTKPEVVWFSDTNANEFIPKIAPEWSGALPATLIIRNGSKEFLEHTVSFADLLRLVDK